MSDRERKLKEAKKLNAKLKEERKRRMIVYYVGNPWANKIIV